MYILTFIFMFEQYVVCGLNLHARKPEDGSDGSDGSDPLEPDLWPLRTGWRRVQRYYDLLWQDVYDSEKTWEIMESPGDISDDLYHEAFNEVADVLDNLSHLNFVSEWWPCRGTLIALLRHGARSGELSYGVDVVERDIDVMVGVFSEEQWHYTAPAIETALLSKGWDRCWTKQSASEASGHQFSTRRDLLYCVRMKPAYMMLDVTSYISTPDVNYVYVHRICQDQSDQSQLSCFIPRLGPLQHGDGILHRSAIHPMKRCLAKDRSVPCPSRPLETIQAMTHSGLSANCIALPDKKLKALEGFEGPFEYGVEHDEHENVEMVLEDVQILRQRSAQLDRMGFQSMSPYFDNCSTLPSRKQREKGVRHGGKEWLKRSLRNQKYNKATVVSRLYRLYHIFLRFERNWFHLPGGLGAAAILADLATKDRICKGCEICLKSSRFGIVVANSLRFVFFWMMNVTKL